MYDLQLIKFHFIIENSQQRSVKIFEIFGTPLFNAQCSRRNRKDSKVIKLYF